ncbi:MAG: maltose alpha-D-glucosyltransferase [Planctomycetales bacterium]
MIDATWYKDAIVYQLHVRAFHDSDGNGVGDFRGLTQKLDYIRDLGATAIWLLPFYPSPLKDDGYDIADYRRVHPAYGTLDDFREFLEESHRRRLRVITELVLNHTSDQHPWFQRARRAAPGSPERAFYVWSDDPHRYADARIIFKDFETSNWEWDPVAEAYFWHRFYKHQPDLNYENPAVRGAMFDVLDFWLAMGVDGLRLDAVPYLFEREGTSCENLPETHEALRELRRHVDERFEGRMLLAEANQWPEDAVAYFGNGDECHTCFHFPLMPRLFMGLEREDRFPIVDILEQTPPIPENCQWMTFLRNHDELTLEMVTDEERDYMYRTYAADPRARINLGIRRRLAPLMGNDRRKVELMTMLLLTLPGTPVIYYGDEIGMGDNIYLGDRDGVRTPMQWSIDRNAGFSKANPQQLYLPVIVDPQFHFSTINVEALEGNPHSLLWWTRRLIALVRKRYRVFGRGSIEFLYSENSRVLVFVRQYGEETALVVANLSRFSQYVELDLARFQGRVPVELFGQTHFPPIGELPYLLTLGPNACLLFSLESQYEGPQGEAPRLPAIDWGPNWEDLAYHAGRDRLEHVLPQFLERQRWLEDRPRKVRNTRIRDGIRLDRGSEGAPLQLAVVHVDYADAEPETFAIPLCCAWDKWAAQVAREHPAAGIAWLRGTPEDAEQPRLLYDASFEIGTAAVLLQVTCGAKPAASDSSRLEAGFRDEMFAEQCPDPGPHRPIRWLRDETLRVTARLHELFAIDERIVAKVFHKMEPGTNLDVELGRFLEEHGPPDLVPRIHATLDLVRAGERSTLAVFRETFQGEGTGGSIAATDLCLFLERVGSEPFAERMLGLLPSERYWLYGDGPECPPEIWEVVGGFLQNAEWMGARTAEMHLALASDREHAEFAPEPFTNFYCRGLYQTMRAAARRTFDDVRQRHQSWPAPERELGRELLELEPGLLQWYQQVTSRRPAALRIRCHGDLHLDKLRFTGSGFRIVDFEGDTTRSYGERRIKRSPLRDVARLAQSLYRIGRLGVAGELPGSAAFAADAEHFSPWADFWYSWGAATLLRSYFRTASTGGFLPQRPEESRDLLQLFVMESAIEELRRGLHKRQERRDVALQAALWHYEARGGDPRHAPV